ncbi:MAG: glycosyltransferase [bacterium]|nr:glycosyltransferase [candidate division KSB1 bacterium]MDH7561716.1 glycosyltransferase [bacterium]
MSPIVDSWRILLFVAVQLAIAALNLRAVPLLSRFRPSSPQPRVSILVPARNEQGSIAACVSSLVAQSYPDFEVLVLDDDSADGTAAVVRDTGGTPVRLVHGQPLPEGWNGKPWACHQLAATATGELLFFTDADTRHQPETLARAVAALQSTKADLLTAITGLEIGSVGELVTVPFPAWSILTLLPVPLAYWLRKNRALVAANGKFLLMRREAYEQVGGHAAVRDHATEDMELARHIKKAGLRWRLVNATDLVTARMYRGWCEARRGFAKNYFALFNYRLLVALFVWSWLMLIAWHPLVTVLSGMMRTSLPGSSVAALVTVGLNCLLWLLVATATGMPKRLCCLYPVVITASVLIGLEAIVRALAGKATWKDRTLVRRKVRLL